VSDRISGLCANQSPGEYKRGKKLCCKLKEKKGEKSDEW
jgi:hypothetical protein